MRSFYKTLAVCVALTTAATANADVANLTIDVSNVTSRNAEFEITCNDPDVPFYYQVVPAVKLEKFGGTSGIYDYQKAEWERYGQDYDCPWTDFILSSMGNYEHVWDTASSWTSVVGGVDYVVFALGMDAEGNLTTNVAFKEFTATAGAHSDNAFNVSLVSVAPMEGRADRRVATIKVSPSNSDTYVATYYGKEFVDKYGDLTSGTEGYVTLLGNMMWNVGRFAEDRRTVSLV